MTLIIWGVNSRHSFDIFFVNGGYFFPALDEQLSMNRHSFATLLLAYFQIINTDMVKRFFLCCFEISVIRLTSAGLQLHCFFLEKWGEPSISYFWGKLALWTSKFEVCPNFELQSLKFVLTGQTITFMESFKANNLLEKKSWDYVVGSKSQLFPKIRNGCPPQVLAMLLLPAVYRADKYLTLGGML